MDKNEIDEGWFRDIKDEFERVGLETTGLCGIALIREHLAACTKNQEISKDDLLNHLDTAWGVIANALDWDTEGRDEWCAAAGKWRDRWDEILKITGTGCPPAASDESQAATR